MSRLASPTEPRAGSRSPRHSQSSRLNESIRVRNQEEGDSMRRGLIAICKLLEMCAPRRPLVSKFENCCSRKVHDAVYRVLEIRNPRRVREMHTPSTERGHVTNTWIYQPKTVSQRTNDTRPSSCVDVLRVAGKSGRETGVGSDHRRDATSSSTAGRGGRVHVTRI